MEKIDLQQPLNDIIEEELEDTINENTNLMLFKSHSDKPNINLTSNQFFKIVRPPSSTVYMTPIKRNLFVMKDGPDDVQTSIMKHTNSAVERMRFSYNFSDEISSQRFDQDRDDLETIKKDSTSDPNAKSAASLYIRSCLVRDMGFPARMVDSLIKYESNILNTDIQQIQPK